MDEYFCPNCGAILNDQYGFDPDDGYWRCTECNEMLTDDELDGSIKFDGVAWFCDDCGAFLNKQFGFIDTLGEWRCRECGHMNPINEDAIYGNSSKSDYGIDDYANDNDVNDNDVNDNDVNDDDDDDYGDYDYDDYGNRKPFDRQKAIEEIKAYQREMEEQEESEKRRKEAEEQMLEEQKEADRLRKIYEKQLLKERKEIIRQRKKAERKLRKEQRAERRAKRAAWWRMHYKGALIAIAAFFLVASVTIAAYEFSIRIPVGISSEECVGMRYQNVVDSLSKSGFNTIIKNNVEDLQFYQNDKDYVVTEVKIGADDTFKSTSKYPSNWPIKITYHSLMRMPLPMSSSSINKQRYNEIEKAFRDAGFHNIKHVQKKDLILGFVTKDGEVQSVTVDGRSNFFEGKRFRPDVEIIITYHTF